MTFLEKNLAAMQPYTPTSAAQIRAAEIPTGFQLTTGTDGVQTFLRVHSASDDPKRLEWLGGTSMPRASATPITAALKVGTENGLALSLGTAWEWKTFAAKLPPTLALFVWEPDAALAHMALTICDLTPELAAGKIVLLVGEQSQAALELTAFFGIHLGYEPPTVLHPLSSLSADRRNTLIAGGEALVRQVVTDRVALVNDLVRTLETNTSPKSTTPKTILALLAAEKFPGERPLRHELQKTRDAGIEIEELHLDHFATCSLALRLQTIARHRPEKIVSDFFRGQLGTIPASLPIETWVPPLVRPGYWQKDRFAAIAATDRVIVHAQAYQQLLESLGVTAIEFRPLKPPAPTPHSAPPNPAARKIGLIADLSPWDMDSLQIILPTHQAVYAAARDIVEAEFTTVHFNSAPDILRRALARAGVPETQAHADPSLNEPMQRIIRDVLIPTAPPLVLARQLKDQGLEVELIGEWPGQTDPANWTPNWQQIAALVHLSPWGVVSPIVLQAAAHNVPIVAPRHPTDDWKGALPTLLPPAAITRPQFSQLLPALKSLLRKDTPQHSPNR